MNGDTLEWRVFNGPIGGERIYSSSGGLPEHPYDIEFGEEGEYNLVVLTTDYSVGGSYQCRLVIEDIGGPAEFVAICKSYILLFCLITGENHTIDLILAVNQRQTGSIVNSNYMYKFITVTFSVVLTAE